MKRAWTLVLPLAFAKSALSQVPISVASDGIQVLKNNNFLHDPLPGFAQPKTESGLEPKSALSFLDLGDSPDFQAKHADTIRREGSVIFLEGNCLFLIRGYKVTSDSAQYDRVAATATLTGHIHIDGALFSILPERGETLQDASSVTINFANNTYIAKNAQSQISPQLIQGGLRDKVYVQGRESFGDQRQTTTLDGSLTTCNYPVPHYDIEARNIVLRPGRRIIFRHTKIRILGYVVAQLPFLSVPLDNRTSKWIPYVGQSPEEGDFAKWLIGLPGKNPNYYLETREDFMTKLGVGLGLDYAYLTKASAGTLSIYHVFGSTDDLTFSSNHRQVFGWGTFTEQTEYDKDNYLVDPGSTTFNTKLAALINEGQRGSDQVSLTESSSMELGDGNNSSTLGIDDRRQYGKGLSSQTTLSYFNTSSTYANNAFESSGLDSQRLDVDAQIQKDFNAGSLAVQYQRSVPIGSSSSYMTTSDETPVITLTSDSRKLFGSGLGTQLPFQTELSWGDFQDPRYGDHITREYFAFDLNKIDNSTSRLKLDYSADFHQGIYSDDTAQYVLGAGSNLRYDLGGTTGVNLRYNYLRPFGYTPLLVDDTGYTNYLSSDLNFRPIKSLLLGAQTGFDFARRQEDQIGWQQIGLRSEFQPAKYFLLRGLYTYDPYNKSWEDVRMDLTYVPGATNVTISSDYDAETHIWTTVDLMVQNFKWGKLTSSTALDYDGYLKQFDSEQFSFTYDLHCAEAVFALQQTNYGFDSGRSVSFFIRIKAFPFDTPFGAGTRGQPIGLSSGSNF
jgi:hypothetical protein